MTCNYDFLFIGVHLVELLMKNENTNQNDPKGAFTNTKKGAFTNKKLSSINQFNSCKL